MELGGEGRKRREGEGRKGKLPPLKYKFSNALGLWPSLAHEDINSNPIRRPTVDATSN